MVEHDFLGEPKEKKEYKKHLIERTLTKGTIIDIGHWTDEKKGKDNIILTISLKDNPENTISCFMNARVAKGSEPAYNTLSYNNLTNLGLIEKFKEVVGKEPEKMKLLENIEGFWMTHTLNKEIKFVPETIQPKVGDKYSIVKEIEGFA